MPETSASCSATRPASPDNLTDVLGELGLVDEMISAGLLVLHAEVDRMEQAASIDTTGAHLLGHIRRLHWCLDALKANGDALGVARDDFERLMPHSKPKRSEG